MGLKVRIGDFGSLLCDEKGVPLVRNQQWLLVRRQTSETITRVESTLDGRELNT